MNLLDFPPEIRLNIYSELLVLNEPIILETEQGSLSPPLFQSITWGLHPALLQTCSTVNREASPFLYSKNRFRFPQDITNGGPLIAPFLRQVGRRQASLIHHICIAFPTFHHSPSEGIMLQKELIDNLGLVRDTCTSIGTLELSRRPENSSDTLDHPETAAEAMDLLDASFKAVPSLKEIIVNYEMYPDEYFEEALEDDLTKMMRDYGWTVTATKLLPRQVWISSDDQFEFDDFDDWIEYDNELDRKEREKEKAFWREEYSRRRDDPYWKNDSDYD